jgi:secreted trypsin-like serine protease
MLRRVFFVASAVAFLGCSGPSRSEEPASTSEAIIGGRDDARDRAVVAIGMVLPDHDNETALCTGTLVAPTKVLTAAHCVDPRLLGPNAKFTVLLGPDADHPQETYAVTAVAYDEAYDDAKEAAGHDIGMITVDRPVRARVMPILRSSLDASFVGRRVRIVGYGANVPPENEAEDAGAADAAPTDTGEGKKRSTVTTVTALSDLLVDIGSKDRKGVLRQACFGDSGGPAFVWDNGREALMGITSFGHDTETVKCKNGGVHTRVDKFLDFVDKNL